eukprot:155801-Rhodomonas_salina.2
MTNPPHYKAAASNLAIEEGQVRHPRTQIACAAVQDRWGTALGWTLLSNRINPPGTKFVRENFFPVLDGYADLIRYLVQLFGS